MKRWLKDAKKENGSYLQGAPLNRKDTAEIPYPNYFDFEQEFNNVGTEGGVPFDGGKKPISFLTKFLEIVKGPQSDITVLDFFGGSGSTAHAIIERNSHGSKSQAILVQLPEPTYTLEGTTKKAKPNAKVAFNAGYESIADITFSRFNNIINGYIDEKGKEHAGYGNNLKYYQTSFVGKNKPNRADDDDRLLLAQKAGCLLALKENTLNLTESNEFFQVFRNGVDRATAIYFQEDYSRFPDFCKVVNGISEKVTVYIFCWSDASEFANEFNNSSVIAVKAIPQPILDIYNSLNL